MQGLTRRSKEAETGSVPSRGSPIGSHPAACAEPGGLIRRPTLDDEAHLAPIVRNPQSLIHSMSVDGSSRARRCSKRTTEILLPPAAGALECTWRPSKTERVLRTGLSTPPTVSWPPVVKSPTTIIALMPVFPLSL